MARQTQISMFLGEARSLIFTIKNREETACVDITGWALSFMVKKRAGDADSAAYLTLTTATLIEISGTFNADPDINTQVATVTLNRVDTVALPEGAAVYELKRTDSGSESVLAYGPFILSRGVHHA